MPHVVNKYPSDKAEKETDQVVWNIEKPKTEDKAEKRKQT